jgi:hypothetical protein
VRSDPPRRFAQTHTHTHTHAHTHAHTHTHTPSRPLQARPWHQGDSCHLRFIRNQEVGAWTFLTKNFVCLCRCVLTNKMAKSKLQISATTRESRRESVMKVWDKLRVMRGDISYEIWSEIGTRRLYLSSVFLIAWLSPVCMDLFFPCLFVRSWRSSVSLWVLLHLTVTASPL